MAPQDMNLFTTLRAGWTELTKIFLNHSGPDLPPALPLDCLLRQHPIASQKRHTAQDGQVLQGLEHVELRPIDIHEPQHSYKDRRHENQLNQIVTLPRAEDN